MAPIFEFPHTFGGATVASATTVTSQAATTTPSVETTSSADGTTVAGTGALQTGVGSVQVGCESLDTGAISAPQTPASTAQTDASLSTLTVSGTPLIGAGSIPISASGTGVTANAAIATASGVRKGAPTTTTVTGVGTVGTPGVEAKSTIAPSVVAGSASHSTATGQTGAVGSGLELVATQTTTTPEITRFGEPVATQTTATGLTQTPTVFSNAAVPESDYRYATRSYPNELIKFDDSGSRLWTKDTEGSAAYLETDAARNVYLSDVSGSFSSYDEDGNLRWKQENYFAEVGGIVVGDSGYLYILSDQGHVHRFDPDTGTEVSKSDPFPTYPETGRISATAGGRVFVTAGKQFYELDSNGSILYNLVLGAEASSKPIIENDRYVSVVEGDNLVRIDTENQEFVTELNDSGDEVVMSKQVGGTLDSTTTDDTTSMYFSGYLAEFSSNGIQKFSWDTGTEWAVNISAYDGAEPQSIDVTNAGVLYHQQNYKQNAGDDDIHRFVARDAETGDEIYRVDNGLENNTRIAAFPDYPSTPTVWEPQVNVSTRSLSTAAKSFHQTPMGTTATTTSPIGTTADGVASLPAATASTAGSTTESIGAATAGSPAVSTQTSGGGVPTAAGGTTQVATGTGVAGATSQPVGIQGVLSVPQILDNVVRAQTITATTSTAKPSTNSSASVQGTGVKAVGGLVGSEGRTTYSIAATQFSVSGTPTAGLVYTPKTATPGRGANRVVVPGVSSNNIIFREHRDGNSSG